ncbi:hypothetical protein BV20DRAFT_974757 [Pilatotrama ljubarskyi]|nr:hypothetical protein BV20DRAFT_974757 [Pilatotrama ljubarskyi]
MSGLPPKIDAEPGTPANEWARSTTTAAFSRVEPAPALSSSTNDTSVQPTSAGVSIAAAHDAQKGPFDPKAYNMNPTTPGDNIPGAYPTTPGEQAAKPNIPISTDTVKETARSAAETATSIAQSAAHTAAQYLPQGVVDTVSSYMPSSSATATMNTARASEHDAEHTTSFPSREITGASSGEHIGGVGSLPGPITESAVPKLPEERADNEKYPTAAGAAATIAGVAYAVKDRVVGSVPSTQDAQAVTQTAKETVQGTTQVAKEKVQGTTETVKQALPGGVSSHSTAVTASTVPSRELFGAQPGDHSSGAGALPGFQDEPHVARLPEESAHPQYDSGPMDTAGQLSLKPSEELTGNESAVGDARHVGGVGALVGGRDESSVALAPDERAGANASGVIGSASRTVPSQEPQGNEAAGAPKHVGGVGALVGGRDEQGATVLPDERVQQQGTGTGTVTQPNQAAPAAPPKHEQKKPSEGAPKSGNHGLPNKAPGYDTDYHPAALHPASEKPGNVASEGEKSLGATQADANRPAEEAQPPHQTQSGNGGDAHGQKAKKAGFMDKMKGEAKVLLGKIEGKHEKVEQGQKLKSGQA